MIYHVSLSRKNPVMTLHKHVWITTLRQWLTNLNITREIKRYGKKIHTLQMYTS